ncbi:MAG: AsmA family protein [Nitrococcus sp.]|nr:AsmA family protein [Nitrococcus sp.]
MGRTIKWFLIAIAGILALLIVLFVAVILLVDPNAYRDEIERAVAMQTGRELAIEGDLELTFFPWIGLQANKVQLADAPGFGDAPFFQAKSMELAVKVLPLLQGNLVLDTITLEQPRIHLIRTAQGTGNWETLGAGQGAMGKPSASAEPAPPRASGEEQTAVSPMLRHATLEGFVINEARVVWEDRQAGVTVVVDPFNLTLENVSLGSKVPIQANWQVTLAEGPTITASLAAVATVAPDLSTATVTDIALQAKAAGEAIPGGEQTVQLSGRVEANLDKGVYRLSELVLEALGVTARAKAQARLVDAGVTAQGSLSVPQFNPRNVFEQLAMQPPQTHNPEVLQALSLEAQFRYGAGGTINVAPLQVRLDDSTLAGTLAIRDFVGPNAAFNLTLDQINVDHYLPPQSEAAQQPAAPPTPAGGEGKLPHEPLRSLTLDGQLHIGKLTVAGAQLTDADITVTANAGHIRIHPLTASLYGGRYEGDIRLDASGDVLAVSLNERLAGIQAQPLLRAVTGFDKLLGSGNFSIDATTKGVAPKDFLKALTGQATFAFNDGMVKGINVAQTIRSALARFKGKPVPKTDAPLQTDYGKLGGTVHFDGGMVRNDDLSVQTPLLRIGGEGKANLIERTLNYDLTVNLVGTLKGQGGAEIDALRNVPIPLHVGGALSEPDISVDIASAFKAIAGERIAEEKAELKQKIEEKKQDVQQKIQEKIDEKLKGLFN